MNATLVLETEQDAYRAGMVIDGRYLLLRRLDEGGMSWVWLARHLALEVPVAVKIIKPCTGPAAEAASREAHITALLHHPAIVTVFDSGRTALGDPFVVMEYLEGCTLAQLLHVEGRLSARAAVELMLPILDALAFCHERGFVHGDIKPANIFVARLQGHTRAKLLDFGVARAIGAPAPVVGLVGTPGYMAPEQIEQARLDERSDVWAACAVLYEAVAGRPAVIGKGCAALLIATVSQEVEPLAEHGAEASLWPILARGLRVAPLERLPAMSALADALAHWSPEQAAPALAAAHPARQRRKLQWLAAPAQADAAPGL